ncbi:hypothetical protein [Actinopolymorpha alba]|uniref:hypothetical protein n=1 Tax=Actinopolymorpha alba TaxID=533267 RepID=UPI0003AA1F55|nr:hypothetical protein [Actinopolymorpha alba]
MRSSTILSPDRPSRSVRLATRRMRHIITALLALVATLAGTLVLGQRPAAAGGPTSVLIVAPEQARVTGIYYSDPAYKRLEEALAEAPTSGEKAPRVFSDETWTSVNVTWLIHDITAWRTDRVLVHPASGQLWISTRLLDAGLAVEEDGTWHRSRAPGELLALFKRLGVLDLGAQPPRAPAPTATAEASAAADADRQAAITDQAGKPSRAADPATAPPAATAARTPVSPSSGSSSGWWWALPALLVGVVGGAVGRPAAVRLRLRMRGREPGARQELIDV